MQIQSETESRLSEVFHPLTNSSAEILVKSNKCNPQENHDSISSCRLILDTLESMCQVLIFWSTVRSASHLQISLIWCFASQKQSWRFSLKRATFGWRWIFFRCLVTNCKPVIQQHFCGCLNMYLESGSQWNVTIYLQLTYWPKNLWVYYSNKFHKTQQHWNIFVVAYIYI